MCAHAESRLAELASKALLDAGFTEPPVDLVVVAESLYVPVRLVDLPGFFKGMVVNEDGMPILVVNERQSESVRRETLAHLLGHVLIVLDGGSYPRDAYVRHEAALAVGDELLMPIRILEEQSRLWFNDYRYLARMFSVSEGMMLDRMRSLGIIKGPRSISWDY